MTYDFNIFSWAGDGNQVRVTAAPAVVLDDGRGPGAASATAYRVSGP